MENSEIKEFIHTTVIAAVSSVVMGLIFFQSAVFQLSHPAFLFLSYGLIGSILFATFRVATPQKGIGVLLLLMILNEFVIQSSETVFILRDVLFLAGLGTAVYIFIHYFYTRLEQFPLSRPLILGSLLALNGIIVSVILRLLLQFFVAGIHRDVSSAISVNLLIGFLIGIGLGIGIELSRLARLRTIAASETQ